MFYSFLTSWNNQLPHQPCLSLNRIIECCKSELYENVEAYRLFIDESYASIFCQLRSYIDDKRFNQPIGDIFPLILANAFNIQLCILNVKQDQSVDVINVQPDKVTHGNHDSLYLHRVNDNHFNGLVRNQILKHVVTEQIQYSRSFLIKHNSDIQITRNTRKILFEFNIWKPRNHLNKHVLEPALQESAESNPWIAVKHKSCCSKKVIDQNKTSSDLADFADYNIYSNLENASHSKDDVTVQGKYTPNRSKISKQPELNIKVGLLNARSVCNKALSVRDLIATNEIDILTLTETFNITDSVVSELLPEGYAIAFNLRDDGRKGGGVAIIYREEMKCSILGKYNNPTLDGILVKLNISSTIVNICIIYAPESKTNHSAHDRFIKDLSPILLTMCLH